MSYDLYFWREIATNNGSPESTCDQLGRDEELSGVAYLNVTKIKERFRNSFPNINDSGSQLEWEGVGSYFLASWSTTSRPDETMMITVSCGFQLLESPESMNLIISVLQEFGCALYDPQTGERYEQPEPICG